MTLAWMDEAWRQEGQKEISGAAANPEIVAFFRDAGHGEVQSDEVAWCAAFACACLERAEIRSPRTLHARDFLAYGTPIDQPRFGAIAVFDRPPSREQGHVAFVVSATATHIVVLGGNQANSVCVERFPRSRLIGLRWPAEPVTAATLKKAGSRTIRAADGAISSQVIGGGATALAVADATLKSSPSGWTATQVASKAAEVKGAVSLAAEVWQFLTANLWTVAIVVGAYFSAKGLYHAYQVRRFRTEDANTGAHIGGANAVAADALLR
jgi:uncharacterized protein (TIGR02594 family)